MEGGEREEGREGEGRGIVESKTSLRYPLAGVLNVMRYSMYCIDVMIAVDSGISKGMLFCWFLYST
jgi:hypothetical protein